MKIVFLICITVSFPIFASEHREHAAHVHGSGSLGIAFDKNIGKLEFKIPSESIFGFEHTAKSKQDKEIESKGLLTLENKFSEMVVFDPSLKCQFKKENIQVVKEDHGGHSNTVATFSVNCNKSPVGTFITFNFQKFFPRIKDLDVQILADAIQKSIEAKNNGTVLELK
jgi:hypothetical protein